MCKPRCMDDKGYKMGTDNELNTCNNLCICGKYKSKTKIILQGMIPY
jgi:hypothetical protein